jgi:RNA polymerase sigma factor (sigma-70 family)
MREVKDYRVTVKVRNNRLLRAIENCGYTPGQKFSDACGVPYVKVNNLLNMTVSPLNADGKIRPFVEKLIDFLCVPFDELFSSEQCEALATNKSEREVDAEQMFALTNSEPLQLIHDDGLSNAIESALGILKEKERKVIEMRYGFNGEQERTLEQIGDQWNIGRERVRQIELNALRKIRENAKTAGDLKLFI